MTNNKKNEIKKLLSREIKIMLGSFLAIAFLVIAFFIYNQKKGDTNNSAPAAEQQNLIRDFNHKKGADNAKIKIVEFYDPECEACSAFFPYLKEIVKRYEQDTQLIVRYALYHGNSILAAKASDAAAIQGKFWEYQEMLFVNQQEWSHKNEPSTSYFIKYAKDLNLDTSKFSADMEDLKRMETINIDLEDGKKIGVSGTPTIFVNGKKLINLSPSGLLEMIEEELKK